MKKILLASALLANAAFTSAIAQHQGHGQAPGHPSAPVGQAPYAGLQDREIKALSAPQMDGLRAGKGMAMAMPAELNGYPGPLHVLEHASKLGLSAQQIEATRKLHGEMQEAAVAQGQRVIEAERELDTLFAQKKATSETVSSAVAAAASAQGRLRETHLRYHLAMVNVLSPEQVSTYNKLRGY